MPFGTFKAFLFKYRVQLGLIFCLLVTAFFSTYKLTESPKTWFDEGIFTQIARNFVTERSYVMRASPTEFVPTSVLATTGFPVMVPVAMSFSLLGVGLLQARIVMVFFILAMTIAVFFFVRSVWGFRLAMVSTLLIATHAPVYGNGKNVLGEVPGLFFFFVFLYFFHRLEQERGVKISAWVGTGFFSAMFMVTKPNFLALAPVLLLVALIFRKRITWTTKTFLAGAFAGLLPFVMYSLTQFGFTVSPATIFGSYANMPGLEQITGLTMPALIKRNLLLFVQQSTPAYLLVTFGVWTSYLGIRLLRKTRIQLHEMTAYGVALLTIAYFLKMPGFFRYLFVAQVITFPYFVPACREWISIFFSSHVTVRKSAQLALMIALALLISFQTYQVLFSSWVAGYYQNTRTQELTQYFDALDPSKSVFFYHVPEMIVFFHGENYFQFFELLYFQDAFGKDQLVQLQEGVPDLVFVAEAERSQAEPYLTQYAERGMLDRGNYLIYERK
ncbi:glycosyltransferase family 39 protein [Patescibacteria group bacterium]|nr:glycosyltransferase family 39 protein [Patescibacteria group bacterium]